MDIEIEIEGAQTQEELQAKIAAILAPFKGRRFDSKLRGEIQRALASQLSPRLRSQVHLNFI